MTAEINRAPGKSPTKFSPCEGGTLEALRDLLAESRIELPASLPPMALGVFGYMGYDTVRLIEKLPEPNPDPIGIPDAVLIRPTVMAIFDNVKDEIIIVTPVRPTRSGCGEGRLCARASTACPASSTALDKPLGHAAAPNGADLDFPQVVSNTTPKEYEAMVKKAKEYIAAGDIFQVVLSQRFSAPFDLPPFYALPRAAPRQSLALPLFPQFWRFRRGRVEPGNPGARPRRPGHHPPDRRDAAARGETPEEDKRLGGRPAVRREGAGRASHAARSRPQRCRPRRQDRHGARHRQLLPRILQPRHAHRLQCDRASWRTGTTRSTR